MESASVMVDVIYVVANGFRWCGLWREGGMQMGYAKYFSSRVLNSIWDENWRETHLSTPVEYSKWGRVLKIVCLQRWPQINIEDKKRDMMSESKTNKLLTLIGWIIIFSLDAC
jgi:hypothetical protein